MGELDFFWKYKPEKKGRTPKDNYDLRIYLALLNNKTWAYQLAKTFQEKNIGYSGLTLENKMISRCSDLKNRDIISSMGEYKQKGKRGPPAELITSNKKLLMDLVKLTNPKAEQEYDINTAINVFSIILHRYELIFHPQLKTLKEDYLLATQIVLSKDKSIQEKVQMLPYKEVVKPTLNFLGAALYHKKYKDRIKLPKNLNIPKNEIKMITDNYLCYQIFLWNCWQSIIFLIDKEETDPNKKVANQLFIDMIKIIRQKFCTFLKNR